MTLRSPLAAIAFMLAAGAATAAWADAVDPPAFDCARAAPPVETMICADPELASADRRMAILYQALLDKQPDRSRLRREQRRWLRLDRNRCADRDCLAGAYLARNTELQQRNREPLRLPAWTTAPLAVRAIDRIEDTRVVGGLALRASSPQRVRLELHVDPDDHLDWTLPGPRVLLECTDPDHREGYAPRFRHRAIAYGVQFTPVWRRLPAAAGEPAREAYGFVLLELELGRDLPLDQDVRCMAVFTEWLLDRPSTLFVVGAASR